VLGGSGNALIGKATQTNSTYRLDVVGNIRGNEVVVNTTGADFVFDPTYCLPKLADIAAYVKINHHLSGIPAAAEMEKDVMTLGGTQTQLLQKVEELTLYAIEADKRYAKLEAASAKQAAMLEAAQKMLKEQHEVLLKLQARLDQHYE
jgi:type II secretory pathway predicted ATPase ExeA